MYFSLRLFSNQYGRRSLCFSFLFSSHNLGVQEMTVVYNITNEPWPKYNMAAIADRGLKPSQWTSARFQTQVLLVETARYICSSSCPRGDCQVHLLFFLCSWRLPGTSALLLVLMETARYICPSSCACDDCQVHLLFFLCSWRLPGTSALLLVLDGVGCSLLRA